MLCIRVLSLVVFLSYPFSSNAVVNPHEWGPYLLRSAKKYDPYFDQLIEIDSINFVKDCNEKVDRKALKKVKSQVDSTQQHPQMLYPHLHLKWTRFIKEQKEAFESAHQKHLHIIDKAQHEDLKKNRYKIFLGGSLFVLPVGWALAHALLFLPQTWATLVGGSIIYFIRGEIIVQRFMDNNRECYSVLKKINDDGYFQKKEEIEQIDLDGHQHILDQVQQPSSNLNDDDIATLLKYTRFLLKNHSNHPTKAYFLLDQIVIDAIKVKYKDSLESLVNNIAVNNVKRWQNVLAAGNIAETEVSFSLTQHFHRSELRRIKKFELIWEKFFWIEWLRRLKLETKIPVGDFLKSEIIEHLRELWPRKNVKWERLQEIKQCLIADFEKNLMSELELAVLGLI